MARDLAVRVDGLRELRRDLRRMQPDALKEVREVIRDAARVVADEARALAPRRTGRLADSIRGTTSGDKGIVRSPLPYAPVHEYGWPARGIKASAFVGRAMERKRDVVVERLGDGIEEVARRNGWR